MCHDAIKRRWRKRRTQEPCGHTTFAKKEELSPKGIPTLLQAGKLSPFPSKKGTQEEILTLGEDVWKHAILPEFRGPHTPGHPSGSATGQQPQVSHHPLQSGRFQREPKAGETLPRRGEEKKKKKRREATHRREVGRGPANNEREARGNRR